MTEPSTWVWPRSWDTAELPPDDDVPDLDTYQPEEP